MRTTAIWRKRLYESPCASVDGRIFTVMFPVFGGQVTVRVVRGGAVWRVYADGGLLGELPFRVPADCVRAIRLRGDLLPTAIYVAPAAPSDQ
ncbi:hypothetical protein EVAR_44207_1 [Eumeta japonica]|uniref:Galectin n=1 Tax=Eumeta variegata TaxID=151549 RepID=A0A4C1W2H1_EUMVA|nr:hypothetical protein EVAR_44207_1 [Eumeta japonica]